MSSGPSTAAQDQREYIFIDESGDPGFQGGSKRYALGALHMDQPTLEVVRHHVAAFRYFGEVKKEFKATSWADKLSPTALRLLHCMEDLTAPGAVVATAIWLDKATYGANHGPYRTKGKSHEFRHFQLRRLLERHRSRRTWGTKVDLVLDRWGQSKDLKRNLEDYVQGNFCLHPEIENVTFVDSVYCDPVQIIDIYLRLVNRVVDGTATAEEKRLAAALMDVTEITGGFFK